MNKIGGIFGKKDPVGENATDDPKQSDGFLSKIGESVKNQKEKIFGSKEQIACENDQHQNENAQVNNINDELHDVSDIPETKNISEENNENNETAKESLLQKAKNVVHYDQAKEKINQTLDKVSTTKRNIFDQFGPEKKVGDENAPGPYDPDPELGYLWDSPGSFKEETFYKNFTQKRKWTDVVWTIIFWINLIVTIVLFVLMEPQKTVDFTGDAEGLSLETVLIVGAYSILIAFVMAYLTLLLVTFFPRAYIKFALVIGILLAIGFVVPIAIFVSLYFLIAIGVIFILLIFLAVKGCCRVNFSADVLHAGAHCMRTYPSTFFFNLLMFIIQSALEYMFSTGAILLWAKGYSYWIYVYVVISYYFITKTITYLSYNTLAGVAAAWYFLNDSEYSIEHPIGHSFANAIGPNFGPVALAGLMEGITEGFAFIKKTGETVTCGAAGCCFCCVQCCCKCFVCCVNCVVGVVSRYALIYCAMFGVPAQQGVKRWRKMGRKKIIRQVTNSTIITATFEFYAYASAAVGLGSGGLIAYFLWGVGTAEFTFMCTMGALFAYTGLFLISKPLEVMVDTIFIGLAEAPTRLETGARVVYDSFDDDHKKLLQKEIDDANGTSPLCCCC